MAISKREKKMLSVFGLVTCAFLYYQFGYTNLNGLVDKKTKERDEIQQKYQTAVDTVNSMDAQKAKAKIFNAKIADQTKPLYPIISQEHIILEIDGLIKESGLEGGITFKEIENKTVGLPKKSEKDKDIPESSIQPIADEYENEYGTKKEEKSSSSNDVVKDNQSSSSSTNSSTSTGNTGSNSGNSASSLVSSSSSDSNNNTINQMHVLVSFNGTYEQVVKFLDLLRTENEQKRLPAFAINMSTKNLNDVKGSVNMMVYAIPKLDDESERYLSWSLSNTYGKNKPFTVNSSVGTGIKTNASNGDFSIEVNSAYSDLPTVIMGKSNDILRTSYAYADGNNEAQGELELTKDGDKYYYKYSVNGDSIPKNYSGNGFEFTPNGDTIEINLKCETRTGTDDKAGLKLNIVNKTGQLVNVNISGNNKSDPRVSIGGDSKDINVNEK